MLLSGSQLNARLEKCIAFAQYNLNVSSNNNAVMLDHELQITNGFEDTVEISTQQSDESSLLMILWALTV